MTVDQTDRRDWTAPALAAPEPGLGVALRAAVDGKAKPPGALGRLEDLAVRVGMIQGRLDPRIGPATVLVFAGDHGLNAEGVSAYPSAITAAMLGMFLSGRATVSAFAAAADVRVQVIDAGVDAELPAHPALVDAKIARGTANAARQPAMTREACATLSTAASPLRRPPCARAPTPLRSAKWGSATPPRRACCCTGSARRHSMPASGCGAGHDAEGLARKTAALTRAAARSDATAPFEVLRQFGGYEIAMMAGAALGAAALRRPVVVDGFIATAAALTAIRLQPALAEYCVFAHCSAEHAHRLMLDILGAKPLLDLGLRLGEGTGAVLAIPLLRAAARLVTDVADLAEVLGPV